MASIYRFVPRFLQVGVNRAAFWPCAATRLSLFDNNNVTVTISEGVKVGQRSSSTFRRAQPTDRISAYRCEYPEPLPEPEPEYPGYTVSYEDFKYVEKLLPKETVPSPPPNTLDGNPTPSGWVSSKVESVQLPYFVHRTKNHMLPIYLLVKKGDTRILTKVRKVDGDIWKLEADLKKYLEENWKPKKVRTQVHEVASHIVIKGDCCDHVCKFLLSKGF